MAAPGLLVALLSNTEDTEKAQRATEKSEEKSKAFLCGPRYFISVVSVHESGLSRRTALTTRRLPVALAPVGYLVIAQ